MKGSVMLLEWAHLSKRMALTDLAKMEMCVLVEFTIIRSEHQLGEALAMATALEQVEDLRSADNLPTAEDLKLSTSHLVVAWNTCAPYGCMPALLHVTTATHVK